MAFTVASWAACLGTIPYDCFLKPLPYILGENLLDYLRLNMRAKTSRPMRCIQRNQICVDQLAVELRDRHRF